MNMGAPRGQAQPENGIVEGAQADWLGPPAFRALDEEAGQIGHDPEPEEFDGAPTRVRVLSAILMVLAVAWTGAALWSIAQGSPALTLPNLLQWLTFLSPPLILLGVAWMLLGQTPRRETERFTRAISAMRTESSALESVLTVVAERMEENHSKLRSEAAKLMSLGDEASDRLGRVAYYLSKEGTNLDKKASALEAAAEAARVDIGVLLTDLPRAEEQARAVAAAMKEAGLQAHEQAGSLQAQVAALAARSREADEQVGGAAQRLGAHLARVDSSSDAAANRMSEAAAGMSAAVDETMARAAEAIEQTRVALDTQSAAVLASVEQNRAALETVGEDSARRFNERVDAMTLKLGTLAEHLNAQDATSGSLLKELSAGLSDLESRFAQFSEAGIANTDSLIDSFEAVRSRAAALSIELSEGQERSRDLIGRTGEMNQALAGIAAQLNGDIPAALVRVEEQAERTRTAAAAIAPHVSALEASAGAAASGLGAAEASLSRQQEALEASGAALGAYLGERLGEVEQAFARLRDSGATATSELAGSIQEVRAAVDGLGGSLAGGEAQAGDLAARAGEIDAALSAITARLQGDTAEALARIETQGERTRGILASLQPETSALEASAATTAARLEQTEAAVARQRDALSATVAELGRQLVEVEQRFAALGAAGSSIVAGISTTIGSARDSLHELNSSLGTGQTQADELAARADAIGASVAAISRELEDRAPAALEKVASDAEQTRTTAEEVLPRVEAIQAAASEAAARIAEAEASLARQQEQLDRLLARVSEGVGTARTELEGLGTAAADAHSAADRIVNGTAPELVEALVRVRETSNQAATHAREAIAAVIPQSVAALAEASREAIGKAVTEPVQAELGALHAAADRAAESARSASERLTRQMLKIGETAAAVEARIDAARKESDAKESENFSRRVALLIESLNSTAIDVTKILSNEVTDSAWAAYLKGDRGVFTRRAVRLLDNSESRSIVQHYEAEPEFREQVNRYIHDFESMLRRILADRDSSALGVTILSSDMGKLYVALAQAIERLR
jgi:hypothetical protein